MSYTVQNVIDAAVQRSDLNNPALVAPAQLLVWLSQFERSLYLKAARINPEYFGVDAATEIRATYTGTWDIRTTPGLVAALTRATIESFQGSMTGLVVGDEVHLVMERWANMEIAPRASVRGGVVTEYNGELSTDASNYVKALRVYYSPIPDVLIHTSQTISLPDEWIDLLITQLAKRLAMRDGRINEVEIFNLEIAELLADFEAALLVYDSGVSRPFTSTPAIPIHLGVGTKQGS